MINLVKIEWKSQNNYNHRHAYMSATLLVVSIYYTIYM